MNTSSARLEVVAGKARGMSIIVEDELIIGRLAQGAGRLADDEEISRSHARISADADGACAIEDLGSTNGTFVNGMRISSPVTLSVGDTIEVGTTTLRVREVPEPPRTPPSTPTLTGIPTPLASEPPPTVADVIGPPALSALGLRLEVDFDAREATIQLDGGAEVKLVWSEDAWQIASERPS